MHHLTRRWAERARLFLGHPTEAGARDAVAPEVPTGDGSPPAEVNGQATSRRSEQPLGEETRVDPEALPDLVHPHAEADIRGYAGAHRFVRAATRWAVLAGLVGVVTGIGASLFIIGLDFIIEHVDALRGSLASWFIFVFPAVGGLAVGYMLWHTDRVAFVSACGTDSFIDAVEEAEGRIPMRVPLLRIIGAWLTIGFGGSSGRECPMIYTGAGIGSAAGLTIDRIRTRLPRWSAKFLTFTPEDTRMLAVCGAAGALGAVFSAPFGGAIFAVEVPYRRDIDMGLFLPALASSSMGYLMGHLIVGRQLIFDASNIHWLGTQEWVLVIVIAVLASLVARLFSGVFNGLHEVVRRTIHDRRRFKWVQTGLGGLAAGLVMIAFPQVYGIGLGAIRDMAHGKLFTGHAFEATALLFAGLLLAKTLATSFTVGTGGVGGLLFPSLFVGAALGACMTTVANGVFPNHFHNQMAYVLIAMSATYAASGKVPVAALLLLAEATAAAGNMSLLVPLAVANLLAFVLSGRSTVYDVQRERAEGNSGRGYLLAIAVVGLVALFNISIATI